MTLEREPAVLRELLRDLHWNKKQSLHQIAKNLGIGRRTLIRLMRKLGVPTRTYRDAIALVSTTGWITADLLKDLYWKKKLSRSQIAEQLGVSAGWIGKLMAKYGIPARTISEAGLKYPKRQFSGNSTEASYMLGLRAGDLHGRIYGLQVRLSTSSTHPAMWRLFNAVFGGYTRVGKSASFSKGQYGWSIYCDLDRSFVFLQSKPSSMTADVLNDEDKFLSFFAAYTDSEGSFRIYPADGVTLFSFRINSQDERILRQIKTKLRSMGYHVYFSLVAKHGLHGHKKYRRDLWALGMFRKEEIVELLRRLPLVHDEKTRWTELMMRAKNLNWKDVEHEVVMLRVAIKQEVSDFTYEAELEYRKKHQGSEG